MKSTLCAFHEPYYTHRKNFCKSFFQKKSKKIFCEIFSFLVHFHLTSEKFSDSCIFHLTSEILRFVHFSLDTKAKLCPSKSVVFHPFHDSTHYYHLLDSPLQMLQVLCTFQSLPKYYYLWVIRYCHTFY